MLAALAELVDLENNYFEPSHLAENGHFEGQVGESSENDTKWFWMTGSQQTNWETKGVCVGRCVTL